MTKLLLGADSREEVAAALDAGADILDIAILDEEQVCSCIGAARRSHNAAPLLCLTGSLPQIESCCRQEYAAGITLFRIKEPENGQAADWQQLGELAQKHKIIWLANPALTDLSQIEPLILQTQQAGLYGMMLESPADNALRLTQRHTIEAISGFIEKARLAGLAAGLSGTLEAPDIPRLLPCRPDILGFSVAHLAALSRQQDIKTVSLVRSLIPSEQTCKNEEIRDDLGTDRLLVRDFILPVLIGAYGEEYGQKQRVCFNVAVDVARITANPEDMSHIFSYDLILDGIRMLVSSGHIGLVETLAERIAALLLAYPRVQRVMVRVEKLDLAPAAMGVEIIREKQLAPGPA